MNTRGILTAAVVALALPACGGSSDAQPEPGPEPAPAPSPAPAPADPDIAVTPGSGSPGAAVTVQVSGFPSGARIDIGMGPPRSEYEVLSHATAGEAGEVRTEVSVPDWVETGRAYVFVAAVPGGAKAISEEFRVVSDEDSALMTVTGELTGEGVECPALRSDSGTLYTLAGDTGSFAEGDRVRVEGRIAEASLCMQGKTLEVEEIRAAG